VVVIEDVSDHNNVDKVLGSPPQWNHFRSDPDPISRSRIHLRHGKMRCDFLEIM